MTGKKGYKRLGIGFLIIIALASISSAFITEGISMQSRLGVLFFGILCLCLLCLSIFGAGIFKIISLKLNSHILLEEGESVRLKSIVRIVTNEEQVTGAETKGAGIGVKLTPSISYSTGKSNTKFIRKNVKKLKIANLIITDRKITLIAEEGGFSYPVNSLSGIHKGIDTILLQFPQRAVTLKMNAAKLTQVSNMLT